MIVTDETSELKKTTTTVFGSLKKIERLKFLERVDEKLKSEDAGERKNKTMSLCSNSQKNLFCLLTKCGRKFVTWQLSMS